tara:strand:- start:43 stop:813 length:771 start_codon:yes stop_codon:yes gene_type:complete
MATLEQLQQQQYAANIIPGYQEMIQPQNVPTGQQLAPGFTPMQSEAQKLMQTGLGSYQPFLTAGGQSLATALQATGPQAATSYMNPYLQQVRDTTETDLNRLFGQQQAQATQGQIQSGGFAGSGTRGAVMDAELARGQGDALAKAMAGITASGYESALKASQQAAKTQAGIGQLYGQLGTTAQRGLMGDVGGLFDFGEAQRQITGAQNLASYQTPFYGLGQFSSALSGMPSFQQYQPTNPILTGMQAGLGAYSMMS